MFPLRGQRPQVKCHHQLEEKINNFSWPKLCFVLVRGQKIIKIKEVLPLPIYLFSYNNHHQGSSFLIFQVVLIKVGVTSGGRRNKQSRRRKMTEAHPAKHQSIKKTEGGMGTVLSIGGGDDDAVKEEEEEGVAKVRKWIQERSSSRSGSPEWIPLDDDDDDDGAVGGNKMIR
jgi:hypothetical protein